MAAEAAAPGAGAPFGLLGRTLGHSYSPRIHEMLGSAPYRLVELPDEAAVRAFFEERAFTGVNVTMPYKKVALACCDEASEVAARLGNANTVARRPDGSLFADNTDYHGFLRLLGSVVPGCRLSGKPCLVMGDGGASLTVRAALADCGAPEVLVASRRGPLGFDDVRGDAGLRARVRVLVNATPVGMFPRAAGGPLLDPGLFPGLEAVVDIVYNPLRTRLVQRARDLGVPARGGLLMLVAQARRSSDLFLGIARDDAAEDRVMDALAVALADVSLIGMPGCGKTGVGRRLADELGKEFVDVDALVEERAGMPIPQIFAERGEDAFRDLEEACTAEACALPGRVVATGGGVVTRPRNLWALRSNGPVVLLTRGLEDDGERLETEGRPVTAAKGLDRLRAERAPLYRAWADLQEGPDPSGPQPVAERIARAVRGRGGSIA